MVIASTSQITMHHILSLKKARQLALIEAVRLWRENSLSPPAHSIMIEQLTVQQDYLRSRMDPRYLPPLPPKPKVVYLSLDAWHI